MDENWKNKFGAVIQERKNKLKTFRILSYCGLLILIISFVAMLLSAHYLNMLGIIISFILFFSAPIVLLIGALFSRPKKFLYGRDIVFYNLYELTNLVEKYQNSDELQSIKNDLLKQIKKLLKESVSLARTYEEQANRYVYPDDEKKSISYFKKNFYYFDYAIKNQVLIPDDILKTIRDNCDEHMKESIKHDTNLLELQNRGLYAWDSLNISEASKIKENKWLQFFINRTLFKKIALYSITITLIVWAFFYSVMPNISDFSKETLFNGGLTVWIGLLAVGIAIILGYKSSSGT